jgi:hypothetical protein
MIHNDEPEFAPLSQRAETLRSNGFGGCGGTVT